MFCKSLLGLWLLFSRPCNKTQNTFNQFHHMYFQVTFQYYVFFVPPPSLLGGSPSPGWPIGGLCFPLVVSWPGIVPIVWPGTLSMAWYGTHGRQRQGEHILDYRGISRPHKPQSTTGSPHSPLNSPLICQRCHLVPPSATIMHPSLVLNLHSKLLIPAFSSSISLYVPDFCDLYPSCL